MMVQPPDVRIGDTVKTERGHQFRVARITGVHPDHAQGARFSYSSGSGRSALSVAIVSVTRTIWRRPKP